MVGVLGSFRACWILYPVYQPSASTAQRLIAFGGSLKTIVQEATMPNSIHVPTSDKPVDIDKLIANLPEILEITLHYLLADFDYEKNIESNTAIAARLLATTATRLYDSMENCHE